MVIGGIYISIQYYTVSTAEQAPFNSFSTIVLVETDRFIVQKTAFTGIGFVMQMHGDSHQSCLVLDHGDQLGKRNCHEILIIVLSQITGLLPERIITHDNSPAIILNAELNDVSAESMEDVTDTIHSVFGLTC